MTDDDFNKSDEELGQWLFESWCAYQAEKRGMPLEEVNEDWIAFIQSKTIEMDSDNADNAPLESAFRKAAKGNFAAAGKVLRSYMLNSAHAMVADKYASIGIKQTHLKMQGGRASGKARADKANNWQTNCIEHAKALLATGTARHELAGKCSLKYKRSTDTIRRVLKKAGVN
jgi:hypothetical protein